MLQLNVSQASTICRASGRAMRSLGIWLRQSAFCKLKKNFSFPWTGKENYALASKNIQKRACPCGAAAAAHIGGLPPLLLP